MEQIILEFEQVTGTSRKFHLEQINFSIPVGYIMGLAGHNGAGKTTLLDYIMNPRKQYTGTIRLKGQDIHENHIYLMNHIGFISEKNPFLLDRTAEQNAEILGGFYESFDMELFLSTLKTMGLQPSQTYKLMSRGEQFKFQMAFAMAHQPNLYLLDEVTVGMDPVFRMDFFKILQSLIRQRETSVLMTSHIASEMEQKMDYVGILDKGKLIQFGESTDILAKPKREVML